MNNSWLENASLGLITTLIGGLDQRQLIAPTAGTPCLVDSEIVECLIVGLFQSSPDTTAPESPDTERTQTAGPIKCSWEELTTFSRRGGAVQEEWGRFAPPTAPLQPPELTPQTPCQRRPACGTGRTAAGWEEGKGARIRFPPRDYG